MLMGQFRRIVFVIITLTLVACNDSPSPDRTGELLIYCGITMTHPINEMARHMEKKLGMTIRVTQGGSEDLYQSLRAAGKGDLYLPGSSSYRQKHLDEGLLGDSVAIGFNQAAIVVKKGNPKQISADPKQLAREDVNAVICNPQSGSIGRETKHILDQQAIFEEVSQRAVYLTTDSRNLNYALKQGDADVTINWRATAFFKENIDHLDVIDLAPEIARPKALVLNLLTFSQQQDAAKAFMNYAASAEGQAIMRRWGFLDAASNEK